MEELLKNREYFEFFLEGGRTRSGKAMYPKGGLLSVIADAVNQGMSELLSEYVDTIYGVQTNWHMYKKLFQNWKSLKRLGAIFILINAHIIPINAHSPDLK